MNIQDLIITVPKGSKPLAPMPDQFELTVDRGARKVVKTVLDVFARREEVRVQTNRPYQASLTLDLPDTTGALLRPIQCSVTIEGSVTRSAEAARQFVDAALAADFDFAGLFTRILTAALNDFAATLNPPGTFVRLLRTPQGPATLHDRLLRALQAAHVFATRIVVKPMAADDRPFLSLQDDANSLEIRTLGMLETHRIGYKARLVWGKDEEHVIARLTYRGTIEGRQAGRPLTAPVVPGQVQPLEAWFRLLLANALSYQTWESICAADKTTNESVSQAISQSLGRGTGRVVEAQGLIIYPAIEQGSAVAESTAQFTQHYAIAGMSGEGLAIEHAIRYTLVDRGRWQACGSPDPAAFLKQQVIEATRSFLLDRRFEDAVKLYLRGAEGERELRDGIATRVGASARSIGHRLGSVATILTIPQMDFVQGRQLDFPERTYDLATPHVKPAITIRTAVRVRQAGDGGLTFARALARTDDFEARVQASIEEAVRGQLLATDALQYYTSHYVNSVVVQDRKGQWLSVADNNRQLHEDLQGAVDAALAHKFGLQSEGFKLVPGPDALIARMRELGRLPITHDEEIRFERGGADTAVTLQAHATMLVESIDSSQWASFYLNAYRLDADAHKAKIGETLHEVLSLLDQFVTSGDQARLRAGGAKEQVLQWFTQRMSEELGLVVCLSVLKLRVKRPKVGRIALPIVESLQRELAALLAQREKVEDRLPVGYAPRDQRATLSARIAQVRDELKEAAAEQEADIRDDEWIVIEQSPAANRLLGHDAGSGPELLT